MRRGFHGLAVTTALLFALWPRALPADGPKLVDATEESGITFEHRHGGCGAHFFVEQIGGGVVLADFDRDGWLDVVLLSGAALSGCPSEGRDWTRFYRGVGGGRFVDASISAGLVDVGYAIGGAAGDVDGDGDDDLFVSCYGRNRLYLNDRGRFTEVAGRAGLADGAFSTSAAFLDYDRDGDLDLYVANYVLYDSRREKTCEQRGIPTYCVPQDYRAVPDRLFQNDGSGKFTDVTVAAGLLSPRGRGLGVATADYDGDGAIDIYVANDATDNLLFHNRGDGTFEEVGLVAGVALSEDGEMENGMGTDWGDFDGDGRLDLVVTNFESETNSLYRNLGGGLFEDVSYRSGTGRHSYPYLGWAAIFADFDLDGGLDLFVANGHVFENVEAFQPQSRAAQENLLFRYAGSGKFDRVSAADSPALAAVANSRGAAAGDLDNDGDEDIIVSNWAGRCHVFRNETKRAGHWLGVRCVGKTTNRSAIGARIVLSAGGRQQVREVRSGGSYLSQNDLRVLFGLGSASRIDSLTVRWVGGKTERFDVRGLDRYFEAVEGEGTLVESAAPAK